MFFYLYAIIELLAFFLDSNIIPTANASYPVSVWRTSFFLISRLMIWGSCSGSPRHIPASSPPHIAAFSSMVSLASSSPKTAHHYHFGCGRLVLSPDISELDLTDPSGCSFCEFLAWQYLVLRSSSPLRPSRAMWGSITASLRRYGLSISSGRWPARLYT